ncbi:pre-mRNA-splicing factor ISY1 homolog isoform X2 [Myxocyprinus asiaticus]|uniref:pre-mRNA-splicing factor ISY1 homolog isoform X2 n=1 Tax=Myxocyprinus asiaticus TaxID=70543 RepID=UPI002223D09A|nr:pre-mRNA-splicing factor ISY1 homolog isoform X2 [Myxocyprinus asiaticus]
MARNAEKAMTALARFRQAQLEEGKVKERRPFLASECNELPKAEKWRRQIISEISKKVAQIQNAGLGEFKIRDLNDEINKLLREKGHWEVRIKELGGPDYRRVGPKMLDHEGKEVPGNRGYKYFGAAKDLPGVRELFEKEPIPPPRKTRAELMKDIDAEYYGYRDEDDGALVPLEQEYEKLVIAEAVEKWRAEKEARLAGGGGVKDTEEEEEEYIYAVKDDESDDETREQMEGEDGAQTFIAHVPVPSQKEIEEALVRRKKMELLQKGNGRTHVYPQSVTPRPVLWSGIDVEGLSWSVAVGHSISGLSLLSLQAISTLCITGKTVSSSLMWYKFLQARPDTTLQHDNATSHTARSVNDFLQDRNVSVLPWPAKSPDLNPIEHVWDLLDRRVRARAIPPEMSRNLQVPWWKSGVTSHSKNWQIWCSP